MSNLNYSYKIPFAMYNNIIMEVMSHCIHRGGSYSKGSVFLWRSHLKNLLTTLI